MIKALIKTAVLLVLLLSLILFAARCSSNPCDNLRAYIISCPDPEASLLLQMVLEANDADTCRQYNDVWWITFLPRCYYDGGFPDAGSDGGGVDSGSDGGPADSGTDGGGADSGSDSGPADSGTDGGGDSGSDY